VIQVSGWAAVARRRKPVAISPASAAPRWARPIGPLAAVIVGALAALAFAAPALAHGADAPDGTDYRTRITAVTPAVPGLAVRTIEAGARLELTNHSGRTIEVLGYSGEPYLEVRPDGVYENVNSSATYLNATLAGDTPIPANASPTAPPSWHKISDEPVARWHDHRMWWMEDRPPPAVGADPTITHRIRDWSVPLRDGVNPIAVTGTLDWVPPPSPGLWWAVCLLGAAPLAALGLLRGGRLATDVLTCAAALGGGAAIAYAVARELDAGLTGLGVLGGLLTSQVWPVLTGLGAIAAAIYAALRRPSADFALALSGACLAVFAGIANVSVFDRAIAPVPWPSAAARTAIAAVIITGAGVAAAALLRMRARTRALDSETAPLS
jgi:hypothetical protein